jgi:hypothetical protein
MADHGALGIAFVFIDQRFHGLPSEQHGILGSKA